MSQTQTKVQIRKRDFDCICDAKKPLTRFVIANTDEWIHFGFKNAQGELIAESLRCYEESRNHYYVYV